MFSIRFCAFFLAAVLAACSAYVAGPDENATLTGTWDWIGSSGGIAGRSFSPATEHYSVRLSFAGGRVTTLRNDSTIATSNYAISNDTVTYAPALQVFVFDPQMDKQLIRSAKGDTITLADFCCDRFDHAFVRRR